MSVAVSSQYTYEKTKKKERDKRENILFIGIKYAAIEGTGAIEGTPLAKMPVVGGSR